MKILTFLICLVAVTSCTRDKTPLGASASASFGFYFLQDESVTLYNVRDENVDLTPASTPWLSEKDIDFYDFSSHCIYLKKPKSDLFPGYKNAFELFNAMRTKPFWVMAGENRCYLGAFHSGVSSLAAFLPYFDELAFDYFAQDVLPIRRSWEENDTRQNETVKSALKRAGLYHAGLSVQLMDIQMLENADIATIMYDIRITNNDVNDLLVLDPDKMGVDLYHYFTIGPVLAHSIKQLNYQAHHRNVSPPSESEDWETAWFSAIKSGQSRSWSITLKGYDKIESGIYDCTFRFANPPRIERKDRYVGQARYWLGEIGSPKLTITI